MKTLLTIAQTCSGRSIRYHVAVLLTAVTATGASAQGSAALRVSEPADSIGADVERFLPTYMADQRIPGVALALIRDSAVVWTKGFGVANAITKRPVTSETIFEVASNSKVVTAYIALRLVDQGLLDLDRPLNDYLDDPWLPASEYRDVISLRHVLSHSSGLGHSTTRRDIHFPPGDRYSYSALGIQYAQKVIERVSGKPLEQLSRALVYTPLAMKSSSFVNRADLTKRTANGHLRALLPTLLFVAAYMMCFIFVLLLALIIHRVLFGAWRPTRRLVIGVLLGAVVVALVLVVSVPGGIGLWEFSWLIALCGLALTAAFAVLYVFGRFVCARISPHSRTAQRIMAVAWAMVVAAGLVNLSTRWTNVPVPRWPAVKAEGAASMRATVQDMARFLNEISDPKYLSDETGRQLRTPQVGLSEDLSWGLGPGIFHSADGDALWQWGQHLDFQSVMILYREHGFGAVVCTNNDLVNPDVAIEIAHRMLGGDIEPIRRAIHLEYNYRDSE